MTVGLLQEQFAPVGHKTSQPDSSLPLSFWIATTAFEEEDHLLPYGNLCLAPFE